MPRASHGSARLTQTGQGGFALAGDLTFATVTALLRQGKALFAPHGSIDIDLSGVTQADSAGLALLLEWLSDAHAAGRRIAYWNLPAQLTAIAEISEVSALLSDAQGAPRKSSSENSNSKSSSKAGGSPS